MATLTAPFTFNTPQLRDLIEARKRTSTSTANSGDGDEEPPLTFFEAVQQEPTMARPTWVDAELTSLAVQFGMTGERNEWAASYRSRYWRGPSTMADPKTMYAPCGAPIGPNGAPTQQAAVSSPPPHGAGGQYYGGAGVLRPPQQQQAGSLLPLPPPSMANGGGGGIMGPGPSSHGFGAPPALAPPQQQGGPSANAPTNSGNMNMVELVQNPLTLKAPVHSRCPFGTFYEDADQLRVKIGS